MAYALQRTSPECKKRATRVPPRGCINDAGTKPRNPGTTKDDQTLDQHTAPSQQRNVDHARTELAIGEKNAIGMQMISNVKPAWCAVVGASTAITIDASAGTSGIA